MRLRRRELRRRTDDQPLPGDGRRLARHVRLGARSVSAAEAMTAVAALVGATH